MLMNSLEAYALCLIGDVADMLVLRVHASATEKFMNEGKRLLAA